MARIELDNGIRVSINEDNLPLLIGRDPGCDICVPTASVSRQHCELYLDDIQLCLRDISSNGTYVGTRRLKGESMPILHPINIYLADNQVMTVDPCFGAGSGAGGGNSARVEKSERLGDRRMSERRADMVVVGFDRRSQESRRMAARRQKDRPSD